MTLDQASSSGAAASATVHRASDGSIRVEVGGPIDLATVDVLSRRLNQALDEQPTALVVSLKDVTFLDSSGINAMMTAYRRANAASIVFTIVNCPAIVERIMRVVGIFDLLTGGDAFHDVR